MKRYLLDTSALLTLRDDEEGAGKVEEILRMAQKQKARCFACFLTVMEIFYRVWKDEGEQEGRLANQTVSKPSDNMDSRKQSTA